MKKPQIKKLDNGLTIVTIITDSPSVTVMSLVGTGSRYEEKSNNGISHFLEHMCFKGTEKKTGKDIMRYLDGLGAETNAFTSYEITGYYVKSITKHWKKTLAVVSDIFLNSAFPESEIEKEKGVIVGEIGMYQDMPMHHVRDIFSQLVYGNQPAGWSILGPRKNINSMTRNDFVKYHQDHYVASATTLVVSGNIQHFDVVKEIKKQLRTISEGVKSKKTKVTLSQKKPQLTVSYRKTDQTHLILGYLSGGFYSKDTTTLSVIAALLGGGMSSRLFEKLREDMGVGYYINAYNTKQSDTGIMEISCGVDSNRVAEVLLAIQSEIQRLTTELVSDKELKKTKEFIIGNTQMGLEATDELAYYYGKRSVLGLPLQTPKDFTKKIQLISSKDIRRVAKKICKPERLNVAIIGPHKEKDTIEFLKIIKK